MCARFSKRAPIRRCAPSSGRMPPTCRLWRTLKCVCGHLVLPSAANALVQALVDAALLARRIDADAIASDEDDDDDEGDGDGADEDDADDA